MENTRVERKEFNEIEYLQRQDEPELKKPRTNENEEDSNESGKTEDEWEKYRESHEPVEHWELRREFIKRNTGRFSENRLLCLSKTFANMEFLGCKYPLETMQTVAECSAGVVEDYRAAKMQRIQRTFVKASDAAERKTKGQKRPTETPVIDKSSLAYFCRETATATTTTATLKAESSGAYISPKNVALQSLMSLDLGGMSLTPPDVKTREETIRAYPCAEDINVTLKKSFEAIKLLSSSPVHVLDTVDKSFCEIKNAVELMKDVNRLHIMEQLDPNSNNEIATLTNSFSACHKNDFLRFDFPPFQLSQILVKCDVFFGRNKRTHLIIHGEGKSQKEAKKDASVKALKFFKQLRPTILVKKDAPTRKVDRDEVLPTSKPKRSKLETYIIENSGNPSKAMKMMLAMGWKGGGLGRQEDGIKTTVPDPVAHNTRLGLGNNRSDSLQFEDNVNELLRAEQDALYETDIEFSSTFTKGERKLIHNLAARLGFNSRSYGNEDNRHLIISRKVEPDQIFREVMAAGGETLKYKVDLPQYLKT